MSGKGSARPRNPEPEPPASKPNDWPQRTRKTWPSRVDLIKPKKGKA